MTEKYSIQDMLPAFFEGILDAEMRKKVEVWKAENSENQHTFDEMQQVWEKTELLRRMQKYNAQDALKNVNRTIENQRWKRYLKVFQQVAAILIVPLLITTLYFTFNKPGDLTTNNWYELKTGAGMRSEFVLPDGTKVYLNSNTTLSYPVVFSGTERNVKLQGEAYFEVAENKKIPFVVNTGKMQIEVTGTEFKASNYLSEKMTEIVLVKGSVNLCQCDAQGKRTVIQPMLPGDKAVLDNTGNKLYLQKVETAKYIAWKDGILMFRDDSMEEVVRRLNRWFSVDITLSGKSLENYVYTATFNDESLVQILDLLKMSAPIDYKIVARKRKPDNTFSKMKIEILQR